MLADSVIKWFGRTPATPPVVAKAEPVVPEVVAVRVPCTPWPAARLALTDRLWGEGFNFPGGEPEALRLTRSMGLSSASSLLLVGGGGGGAACAVAQAFGAWVAAREFEPELVAAARGLITRSQLGRKVTIDPWEPDKPSFEVRKYHHCVAFEPLSGQSAEQILHALARALKPLGQLVMMDLVADAPLDPGDRLVRRWAGLERRDPERLMPAAAVTKLLGRVHLDVRIAEDLSDRHMEQAVQAWQALVRDLKGRKPESAEAAYLVGEAEMWLLRSRLLKEGRMRLMRWQAISPGASL